MKKLSVITVVLNDERNIRNTIESVISQPFFEDNVEYIVIDGGSTDGTIEAVEAYGSRISTFLSERDCGIYNAMNKSLKFISGEWCLFLNSGDKLVENCLSEDLFNVPDTTGMIVGSTLFAFEKCLIRRRPYVGDTLDICHQSALIRSDLMKKFGYDESFKICADMKLFYQIRSEYGIETVGNDIAVYDMFGYSSSNVTLYCRELKLLGVRVSVLENMKYRLKHFFSRMFPALYGRLLLLGMKRSASRKDIIEDV